MHSPVTRFMGDIVYRKEDAPRISKLVEECGGDIEEAKKYFLEEYDYAFRMGKKQYDKGIEEEEKLRKEREKIDIFLKSLESATNESSQIDVENILSFLKSVDGQNAVLLWGLEDIISNLEFQKDNSHFEYEVKIDISRRTESHILFDKLKGILGGFLYVSPKVKEWESTVNYFGDELRESHAIIVNPTGERKFRKKGLVEKLDLDIENSEFVIKRHEIIQDANTVPISRRQKFIDKFVHGIVERGILIRDRSSTKIVSFETGNGYSITYDFCSFEDSYPLNQVEVEYVGHYPQLIKSPNNSEEIIAKELLEIGNEIIKISRGNFTKLTKYEWLLNQNGK